MTKFLILFFCFSYFCVQAQWDFPVLQNFPNQPLPNDRVNAIAQNGKGIMFFGKDGGLLSYDGTSWNNIKFYKSDDNVEDVKCLGSDKQGNIWVGCRKSIGILKNAPYTLEEYHVLYKIDSTAWGDPGKIWAVGDFIYVWFTNEKVVRFQYSANTLKPDWYIPAKIELIFMLNQQLYTFKSGKGLSVVNGKNLKSVEMPEDWKNKNIRMAIPDGKSILLGTSDGKIARFDEKDWEILNFPSARSLLTHGIFDGILLPDRKIFIALLTEGGLVLDLKNKDLVRPINKQSGLPQGDIYACFIDQFGGLWLAHGYGLSRLWAYSPIEDYKSVSGLKSRILSVVASGKEMLAITEDGLYEYKEGDYPMNSQAPEKQESRLKVNNLPAQKRLFVKVKALPEKIKKVQKADNTWIAGSQNGLFEWSGSLVQTIIRDEYIQTFLIPEKQKNVILVVSGAEVKIYQKKDKKWSKVRTLDKLKTIVFSLIEDRTGKIWAGTESGALVLDFKGDYTSEPKILYNDKKVHTDVKLLFGRPFVFAGTSISSFVNGKFQNETYTKDKKATFLKQLIQKKAVIQPIGDNVLAYSQGVTYILKKKDMSYQVDTLLPEFALPTAIEDLYATPDGKVFVALKDRIMSFSIQTIEKLHQKSFPCLIRNVSFAQTKGGTPISTNKFIEIEFVGLNYDNDEALHYQYILEGNMENWSTWQRSNKVNFNSLTPKNYVFKVRAINTYGQISSIAEYHFTVSPAWYASIWAYILYVILIAGLIYLIILYRIKVLEDQKNKLEALIQERTRDIENKNEELKLSMETIQNQQEQIVQSEKMAALGSIVANTAHELNTPIGAIKNSISSIHESLPHTFQKLPEVTNQLKAEDQEIFYQYIQQIIKNPTSYSGTEALTQINKVQTFLQAHKIARSERMAEKLVSAGITSELASWVLVMKNYPRLQMELTDMIAQFGKFANNIQIIELAAEKTRKKVIALKVYTHTGHDEKPETFDLAENIETVFTIYNNYFKNDVKLIKNYEITPLVMGWSDNLMQIWTNLIFNAIQAMGGKGELQVHIIAENDGYLVKIQDSGPGIPPEIIEKIFMPLFTTKAKGEGTGLGLSICQKMIEKHQGKLSVTSEPGKTIFSVWLPKSIQEIPIEEEPKEENTNN